MESSFDEIKTPNKTPRKRAVRKSVLASDTTETPKRRVARATNISDEPEGEFVNQSESAARLKNTEVTKVQRKAPTPINDNKTAQRAANRRRLVVVGLLIIGIGASAAVGFTDQGQIDVMKTIEQRNQRIRTNTTDERDAFTSNVEVPVQNTSNKPDGGLVGRGIGAQPPEVKTEEATSTASSTDATASSTEAVSSSTDSGTEEPASQPETETTSVPAS